MGLTEDAQVAQLGGLKFEVTRKAARGARWQTVETGIEDLAQAIKIAKAIDDYKSGVSRLIRLNAPVSFTGQAVTQIYSMTPF